LVIKTYSWGFHELKIYELFDIRLFIKTANPFGQDQKENTRLSVENRLCLNPSQLQTLMYDGIKL